MAKKESTAVAEQPKTNLAEQQKMEEMYAEDAGKGLEQADRESFAMPFLVLLQKLSPQCDPNEGAYIEGAQAGKFLNTVTGELFDTVDVIPVHYERRFLRWAPREEGGGFRGQYTVDDPIVANTPMDDEGKRILTGGDMLRDTRLHYCLMLTPDGNYSPVLVNLSSTQVKKSRQWCSKMDAQKIKLPNGEVKTKPTFSNVYKLSSVAEQNEKGKWHGVMVELSRQTPLPLYQASKAFLKAITAGQAKVEFKDHQDAEGSENSSKRF